MLHFINRSGSPATHGKMFSLRERSGQCADQGSMWREVTLAVQITDERTRGVRVQYPHHHTLGRYGVQEASSKSPGTETSIVMLYEEQGLV
ncbi:hypothetical protein TNCV_4820611 [Trichonephila clavipes]|nr:hypothetical protein TNCV_4820611 [Trichonephila clavipes]